MEEGGGGGGDEVGKIEEKEGGAKKMCEGEKEAWLTVIPESDMGKMFFCFTLSLWSFILRGRILGYGVLILVLNPRKSSC